MPIIPRPRYNVDSVEMRESKAKGTEAAQRLTMKTVMSALRPSFMTKRKERKIERRELETEKAAEARLESAAIQRKVRLEKEIKSKIMEGTYDFSLTTMFSRDDHAIVRDALYGAVKNMLKPYYTVKTDFYRGNEYEMKADMSAETNAREIADHFKMLVENVPDTFKDTLASSIAMSIAEMNRFGRIALPKLLSEDFADIMRESSSAQHIVLAYMRIEIVYGRVDGAKRLANMFDYLDKREIGNEILQSLYWTPSSTIEKYMYDHLTLAEQLGVPRDLMIEIAAKKADKLREAGNSVGAAVMEEKSGADHGTVGLDALDAVKSAIDRKDWSGAREVLDRFDLGIDYQMTVDVLERLHRSETSQ